VIVTLRLLAILSGALIAAPGCTAQTGDSRSGPQTSDDPAFTTTFTRIADTGFIDMSLDVENPTDEPVTLVGRLVARDSSGAELPEVRVGTAFGTETGKAVVYPGVNVDFVQLEGRGENRVREITLEDLDVTVLDSPADTEYVELKALDSGGRELDYDMDAHEVRLENPNPFAVRIRVVLMVLRAPEEGVPQEATLVRDVTTVEAEASGDTVVDLDAKTRAVLRREGLTSFVTLRPVLAP
jgi:hypothetical protein